MLYGPLLPFLALLLIASPAMADIFTWVDEHGRMHFSDSPPPDRQASVDRIDVRPQVTNMAEARRNAMQTETRGPSSDEKTEDQADFVNRKRQACRELQVRIRKMSGPVRFFNASGDEVRVSESERKARVERARQRHARQCKS